MITVGLLFLSGCQTPTTFQHVISLHIPPAGYTDPNVPEAKPIDPLDILSAIEKTAGKTGLKPYTTNADEASLLDIADSDLTDDMNNGKMNVTEWKHPELPVYLTITRKAEEILILLNHTSDTAGKPNPAAQKLFESIQKQLKEMIENWKFPTD